MCLLGECWCKYVRMNLQFLSREGVSLCLSVGMSACICMSSCCLCFLTSVYIYSFTSLSRSDCHGSGSVFRKFVCVCQRLQ